MEIIDFMLSLSNSKPGLGGHSSKLLWPISDFLFRKNGSLHVDAEMSQQNLSNGFNWLPTGTTTGCNLEKWSFQKEKQAPLHPFVDSMLVFRGVVSEVILIAKVLCIQAAY